MRSRHLLGIPVVAAVLLAGCSTGPAVGPLGNGSDRGQQCSPGRIGEPLTIGLYDLHDYSKSSVKITDITLPPPHGLKRTGSWWLTPILRDPTNGNWMVLGAGYPFPPTFSKLAREEWRRRQPLIGAVIHAHQQLNLVFELTRTAATYGIVAGPKVTYTSAGQTWTLTEHFSIAIAANCSNVPD
jgi:hypothetical protein